MSENQAKARPAGLQARLVEFCGNPVQLRVAITVVLLGAWYVGFAMPLSTEIDDTAARVSRERKRLELAVEIEKLRAQVERFARRLPETSDSKEWLQYMLDGVRKYPALKLVMLDTDGTKEVGPYKAMIIKMDVEGPFREADAFLRWLESNPRLLRVDSLRIEPVRAARGGTSGRVAAQMVILGATG